MNTCTQVKILIVYHEKWISYHASFIRCVLFAVPTYSILTAQQTAQPTKYRQSQFIWGRKKHWTLLLNAVVHLTTKYNKTLELLLMPCTILGVRQSKNHNRILPESRKLWFLFSNLNHTCLSLCPKVIYYHMPVPETKTIKTSIPFRFCQINLTQKPSYWI